MTPLVLLIVGGIAVAIWLIVTDRDRTPQQKAEDAAIVVLGVVAVAADLEDSDG